MSVCKKNLDIYCCARIMLSIHELTPTTWGQVYDDVNKNELETNLKILTFACDEPGGSDQLHNTTESSTDYDH